MLCIYTSYNRFCVEHKTKLIKVSHIFLTRVSSETCGGLPGLLLTLRDVGVSSLKVGYIYMYAWNEEMSHEIVDAQRVVTTLVQSRYIICSQLCIHPLPDFWSSRSAGLYGDCEEDLLSMGR